MIDLASKYSDRVAERFYQESITEIAFNDDYQWDGVKTVNVYTMGTSEMNDYVRNGQFRYGTAEELTATVTPLIVERDRSFAFTIDRGNYEETNFVMEAGVALDRQMREVVAPEIDQYRLATLVAGAGRTESGIITPANAYDAFLEGITHVMDSKAPMAGTFAFVSTNFLKSIRLDGSFSQVGHLQQELRIRSQAGFVDEVPIIVVPSSLLPGGTQFIVTNQIAAVSPMKIESLRLHEDPPGINGWLGEGRILYDAFVIPNRENAIYVHA